MKRIVFLFIISSFLFLHYSLGQQKSEVKIWEDTLTLPTYILGPNDVNPMFFRNDSYQGASRVIYPYPVMDNYTNIKANKTYKALYLENKYIRLCILPELGGKLFYATDKTNNYEIFYRQHVIKPAQIGMLGAWISGGIEWCVFHHHRASTFLPVDYSLVENPDGSKTIWFGETEPRQRMKWSIGITLYPERSYIEAHVKLFNGTENPNSILYWANVATHVNDSYRVFFPPSVQNGVYHAKNSFSHWPITVETYNGYEYYQDSIDASWWKNHPKPISFFAFNLKEGFLAGYDYSKNAGTIHVADQHIAAGAKLWEWGPGPEGSFWDTKVLTDTDGPYAELMAGAFSDNQPDYSWIKPYEVKEFKQFWYPLRETRGVKNANLEGCVNLDMSKNKIFMSFNTTSAYTDAQVSLTNQGKVLYAEKINIEPAKPWVHEYNSVDKLIPANLRLSLLNSSGKEIISYQPVDLKYDPSLPEEVKPPQKPEEIKTNEELYFTGLHIQQFHNAQLNAMDYYNEALRRDPLDTRCNIAVGLDLKKRGMYDQAAEHFRLSLKRLAKDYTRPQDCEALYHLGSVLMSQEKYDDAYDTLFRATWDYAFRSAAWFQLARISCIRKDFIKAEDQVQKSLETNALNPSALNLKAAILRKSGKVNEAIETISMTRSIDELDPWCRYELYLDHLINNNNEEAGKSLADLKKVLRNNPESCLELATGYMNAGFDEEAEKLLTMASTSGDPALSKYPTIDYYHGYLRFKSGDSAGSKVYFTAAGQQAPGYCNPFRLENVKIFNAAIRENPGDAMAYYYLGNLLYDRQPVLAMNAWEKTVELKKGLSIAWRNLGWGHYYTFNDISKAISCYETAIDADKTQPKYYFELDHLYEENNTPLDQRLKILTSNHEYVVKREDALTREIRVLILNARYDQAIDYLDKFYFHAQEETRNLHDTYVDAHLMRGISKTKTGDFTGALNDFIAADKYPDNQQIGRDPVYERLIQVYYYIGLGYDKTGNRKLSKEYFQKALDLVPSNDWYAYYKALILNKLGKEKEAVESNEILKAKGESLLNDKDQSDYFAKFGNTRSGNIRKSNGYLALGLYDLMRGDKDGAREKFNKSIGLNLSNVWAKEFLEDL